MDTIGKLYYTTEHYPGVKFPVEAMDGHQLYQNTPSWFSNGLLMKSIIPEFIPPDKNEKMLGFSGETVYVINNSLTVDREELWWFPKTSLLLRDANGKYFKCHKETFKKTFLDYSNCDYMEKFTNELLADPRDLAVKLHMLVDILIANMNELK